MIDIVGELNRLNREVGEGPSVLVRRELAAACPDVWDACTDPARIGRWFLPVTGEFHVGGSYQLEGNAGGDILECEPPRLLRVTWGMDRLLPSQVEVRLTPIGDERTLFELEHSGIGEPDKWEKYGPGAVGVGWDLTALGLSMHLADPMAAKPEAFHLTEEFREFVAGSAAAWATAHEKSGASADAADAAARNTAAFYTGTP